MTYPKIKPCPDCGNADVVLYGYGDWGTTWHVECDDCHYMGPGDNKLMAIRRHNLKSSPTPASTSGEPEHRLLSEQHSGAGAGHAPGSAASDGSGDE